MTTQSEQYYSCHYTSPLGGITMLCVSSGLCGLWFDGQKYFGGHFINNSGFPAEEMKEHSVLKCAAEWLDIYFSGREPDFLPPLHLEGSRFQQEVWKILRQIPYGKTVTYKELARRTAENMGRTTMSAQAVGGAVGRNPVSVIVPCHRVLGSDGGLKGYAGGIEKKRGLLVLERALPR